VAFGGNPDSFVDSGFDTGIFSRILDGILASRKNSYMYSIRRIGQLAALFSVEG